MKKIKILSIGTMYVDINCIKFPFTDGLFVNRETTGQQYLLELGGSALNFAKMTTALEMSTTFIGKVGEDVLGKQLLTMMKQNKVVQPLSLMKKFKLILLFIIFMRMGLQL